MPRLIVTAAAAAALERHRLTSRRFDKSPPDSGGTVRIWGDDIEVHLGLLEETPDIGMPFDNFSSDLLELFMPFADSGLLIVYRFDEHSQTVYVLAIRRQALCDVKHPIPT